jgi:hypothetical protein
MSRIAPTRFQSKLMMLPEDVNLFLGGGRGGGKSFAAALMILRHLYLYKESAKILVVRNQHKANSDFEDLIESIIRGAVGEKGYVRNRQDHTIRLDGGGMIEFGEINAKSYPKYQGRQFSLLVVDEAGEFTSLAYVDKLQSNLRQPGVPIRTIVISNPGGLQHVTLSKRYVTGRTPWKEFDIKGMPWIYCPSVMDENPYLDKASYIPRIRMAAGNDEGLFKAWVTGDWSAVSDAFFSDALSSELWFSDDEWRPPNGNVWDTGWNRGIVIDWGQTAPCITYYWAQPMVSGLKGPRGVHGDEYPVGSYIVVGELALAHADDPTLGLNWPPQQLAEQVKGDCLRFNTIPKGPCDDSRGFERDTLIKQLRKYGLSCSYPTKDRIYGWVKLKSMMSVAARHGSLDPLPGPGIWLSENCRYAADTLSTLPRNKLRMEDLDTDSADHAADALRYLACYESPMVKVGRGATVY